jgi:signal transduction histidine kinase
MFHQKSVKLAALYLAIVMAIALFFSANVYQLSMQELDRGLRRPSAVTNIPIGVGFSVQVRDRLEEEHEQQYMVAKQHIVNRLLIINVLILIGGGMLCYYLALRTLKPIEEAHEALERFTADASHELRTPITAMRSENEVTLMDPKLTLTQAKQQLTSNVEELEKLSKLSDGLLRLARLGNNGLEKTNIKLADVISKAVDRVLPSAEKKHILIHAPDLKKETALADEASLTEALFILIDNAVKYSPDKSEIHVPVSKKGKQTTLSVADQGAGINASELPFIFERFYRADSSRTKQHVSGYGLGLAIAKDIAKAHDGSLTVSSAPNKGSTFAITIPDKT